MSSVPLAIKTEEVILENAEYNSAEELDEELQLQLEDSGGENTYHIEYTTEPAHQVTTSSQRRQSNMSASNTTKDGGGGDGGSSPSGKPIVDTEKRMRREIANSNERRRMQSINAGFQSLRSLLPRHEGEKLSKAAILQQTFQYIVDLEHQKTQLLTQNSELKRQVGEHEAHGGGGGGGGSTGDNYNNSNNVNESSGNNNTSSSSAVAIKKRKLTDNVINMQTISDSSDEGLGSMSPEPMTLLTAGGGVAGAGAAAGNKLNNASIIAAKELLEMKKQLEKERSMRRLLEDELQMIKRQLYSVATAPPGTAVAAAVANSGSSSYIPREVIEHTDNFVRAEELEELGGTVSYVEIDEMTGQQQVVVCSSIEELEGDAAAEIISEDQVHEEVILSSNSSTESENEVNVNAIAKAYAEGMSTPILQAAIKATPKVEVERINEKIVKVKTEKLHEQPSATAMSTTTTTTAVFTRSRQNLETIVEAIRHLEGDHLFDGDQQHKLQQQYQQQQQQQQTQQQHQQQQHQQQHQQQPHQQQQQHHTQQQHHQQDALHSHHQIISTATGYRLAQDAPLALTTGKQHAALAELRPFLQLKGNKQVIITTKSAKDLGAPSTIFKVQTSSGTATASATGSSSAAGGAGSHHHQPVTITTALKQCRPGVIVAKQLPSS
ncbi:probable E3 ubiquitin-protein ligase bre1 [Drosophila hydei]|uniref:Probable E3 ubiquitin-protein ligase bre1 n=1 Tax=Drosophila hydei TaxID=7224 RepID=A0A6J2SSR7_DROHY|nr:probable E3 ubiquitin-protein ligase bre1 [Drosophila hydei]